MGYISTDAFQTLDKNNRVVTNVFAPTGATQKLTPSGSSVASAVFNASTSVIVRIVADADVHYVLGTGDSVTADNADIFLPADVGEQIRVPPNYKIAVFGTANFYATILE